jgi:hypothetical protein
MENLHKIYFGIPNFNDFYFGKMIDKVLLRVFEKSIQHSFGNYLNKTENQFGFGLNTEKRDEEYIVSLTSFPARIDFIWITIETLLRQTFKPDKIVLWLKNEDFTNRKLPESLERMKEKGLTIGFCDNLRAHNKYFDSMLKYPDSYIITVDDDTYYPQNLIQSLIDMHTKNPNAICANRVHKMTFNNINIKPYRKWFHNFSSSEVPSHLLLPTGVGGVLYPPNSLHKDVFNVDLIKKLCMNADDLWLKIASIRNNTKVVTNNTFTRDFITVGNTQKVNLVKNNSQGGGNDEQLKSLCEYYKIDLYDYR